MFDLDDFWWSLHRLPSIDAAATERAMEVYRRMTAPLGAQKAPKPQPPGRNRAERRAAARRRSGE